LKVVDSVSLKDGKMVSLKAYCSAASMDEPKDVQRVASMVGLRAPMLEMRRVETTVTLTVEM